MIPSGARVWIALGHTNILARIADRPVTRLNERLSWNWGPCAETIAA
jgi:hypothetical protein